MEWSIPLITVAFGIISIQSGLENHTTILLDTRQYYLILGKIHVFEYISLETFDYSRYGLSIMSCLQLHYMPPRHFKICLRHISYLSFWEFWRHLKIRHYQLRTQIPDNSNDINCCYIHQKMDILKGYVIDWPSSHFNPTNRSEYFVYKQVPWKETANCIPQGKLE